MHKERLVSKYGLDVQSDSGSVDHPAGIDWERERRGSGVNHADRGVEKAGKLESEPVITRLFHHLRDAITESLSWQ